LIFSDISICFCISVLSDELNLSQDAKMHLDKGKSYDVKIKNNGKQFRNYISVKDAARMILHFLKKRRQKIIYTGGEKLSIKSMMYCLKRNNFIKNIYFSRKKQDDQIVKSNFKFNHLSFKKNIMLIKNQTK